MRREEHGVQLIGRTFIELVLVGDLTPTSLNSSRCEYPLTSIYHFSDKGYNKGRVYMFVWSTSICHPGSSAELHAGIDMMIPQTGCTSSYLRGDNGAGGFGGGGAHD